jgi:hypothetical protein
MDDGTIAWMIRGGSRTETREAQLQRLHRAFLSDDVATDRSAPSTLEAAAGWRDRLTGWVGRTPSHAATAPDCCPA